MIAQEEVDGLLAEADEAEKNGKMVLLTPEFTRKIVGLLTQPRFFFDTDDSSHWYMIPLELRERWKELNRAEDWDTVNNEFEQYRLYESPQWNSFTDPQEI